MQRKGGKPRGSKKNIWLRLLYWGLVAAAIWFAYLNIQPYEKAVAFLSGKSVNAAFLAVVSWIPIINGIVATLAKGITWIFGTILWGIIQIIEVLPLILYNHEGFVANMIAKADGGHRYQEKDSDDPTLKMLKRIHNGLPTSIISNLETIKIFTYTVDFLICIFVYSPVASGNFSDFFFVLATGQWSKLDYGNLMLVLITLFAIEVIVSLIIWIGKLSYAFQESTRQG